MKAHHEFINESIFRIDESLERIILCLDKLDQNQIWFQSNKSTNSIGNLVVHLSGNITQYILAGLGEYIDKRKRDLEFDPSLNHNREELEKLISETIKSSKKILLNLNQDDLKKEYKIQGFNLTGIGVIIHVVEHLSYHTGQIALLTKLLKNEDLGFYSGLDLNITE